MTWMVIGKSKRVVLASCQTICMAPAKTEASINTLEYKGSTCQPEALTLWQYRCIDQVALKGCRDRSLLRKWTMTSNACLHISAVGVQ